MVDPPPAVAPRYPRDEVGVVEPALVEARKESLDGRPRREHVQTGENPILRWLTHAVVFAVVFAANLWNIGVPDPASDEWTYYTCGYRYVSGSTAGCNPEHPPLAKLLYGLVEHVIGQSLVSGRIVAGFASIATSVVLYLFVRQLTTWRWGLVAAVLWGATYQYGVGNGVVQQSLRISRFALLDPIMCLFLATALYAGYNWYRSSKATWAAMCGFAAVAATCSKEVAFAALVIIVGLPIASLLISRRRFPGKSIVAVVLGGGLAFILSFAVYGLHGTVSEIHSLLSFQFNHATGGGPAIFGGHLYLPPPWWAGLRMASDGLSRPLAIVMVVGVVASLFRRRDRWVILYVLSVSLALYLTIYFSDLQYSFYWIDWEPGLVVACTCGLAFLWRNRRVKPVALALLAVVALNCVSLLIDVGRAQPGPYKSAAERMHCRPGCVVLTLTNNGIFWNYGIWPDLGGSGTGNVLFAGQTGGVEIPASPGTRVPASPDYFVVDPNSFPAYGTAYVPHVARPFHREFPGRVRGDGS